MEILIVGAVIIAALFFVLNNGKSSVMASPSMDDNHLLSAIVSQADSLQRAISTSSIVVKAKIDLSGKDHQKQTEIRENIAKLCLEAISRADKNTTHVANPFTAASAYSKELETQGVTKQNAAVRAVKEKMVIPAVGDIYRSNWEIKIDPPKVIRPQTERTPVNKIQMSESELMEIQNKYLPEIQKLLRPSLIKFTSTPNLDALNLFNKIKDQGEASLLYKNNLFSETEGDKLAAVLNPHKSTTDFLTSRTDAGLTIEDIRLYKNLSPFMSMVINEIMEYSHLNYIEVSTKKGVAYVEAAQNYRKKYPIFGLPDRWDISRSFNEGFTTIDADIFIEFLPRINKWLETISEEELDKLLKRSTSFNAVVRYGIEDKLI